MLLNETIVYVSTRRQTIFAMQYVQILYNCVRFDLKETDKSIEQQYCMQSSCGMRCLEIGEVKLLFHQSHANPDHNPHPHLFTSDGARA